MPKVPASIHKMRESANTVLHYTAGEGVGTTTQDTAGLGHTGTLAGGTVWVTTGRLRQALSFPGTAGNIVSTPTATDLNPTNITIALWGMLEANGSYPMWCTKFAAPYLTGYELRCNAANRTLEFLVGNGSSNNGVNGVTALTVGIWYFLVGTYDGTNTRVYIDGVQDATTTVISGNIASNTNTVYLGDRVTGNPLQGRIDDLLIENVAWSAAKVKQEFELLPYATCYA